MEKPVFTHYGWYFNIIPIRMTDPESGCPALEARYVPEYFLAAVEAIVLKLADAIMLFDPDYQMEFPLKITGEY